jgi:hypothetical protein
MTQTNQSYRQYLIDNANSVMEVNLNQACQQLCGCSYRSEQSSKDVKYIYKSQLDNSTPYGYERSDLKTNYIERQIRETARAYAPIITTRQYLKE